MIVTPHVRKSSHLDGNTVEFFGTRDTSSPLGILSATEKLSKVERVKVPPMSQLGDEREWASGDFLALFEKDSDNKVVLVVKLLQIPFPWYEEFMAGNLASWET